MQEMIFMDLCMLNIEYIHIYFNLFTDILTILGLEKSSIPIILTGISGHFSKVCIPFSGNIIKQCNSYIVQLIIYIV